MDDNEVENKDSWCLIKMSMMVEKYMDGWKEKKRKKKWKKRWIAKKIYGKNGQLEGYKI